MSLRSIYKQTVTSNASSVLRNIWKLKTPSLSIFCYLPSLPHSVPVGWLINERAEKMRKGSDIKIVIQLSCMSVFLKETRGKLNVGGGGNRWVQILTKGRWRKGKEEKLIYGIRFWQYFHMLSQRRGDNIKNNSVIYNNCI